MSVSAVRQRQWLLALLVFACGLVMVSFWLRHSAHQEEAKSRALAADLAADHAQSLQRGIERALSATYAIAALVHQDRGFVNDFNGVATQMLPFYPGISALGLSPGGVICCVVPRAGNEKSIGFNQLADVAQNKEARRARDTGKLTLAGPVQLAQGGLGVVGRLPIFLGQGDDTQVFWGFSYVTLRFPQALESARLELLRDRGYAYELWRKNPETGERQRIEAWKPEALRDPVGRDLELPNGAWTLSLAPTRGWVQRSGLMLEGLVGAAFSALLAYLAWLLYAMRLRDLELEALVAQRTSEILAAQRHLQATISAIPDLMFEVDLDGRYYSTHSPREELLARPSKELLGRTVHDVMPQAQADRVLQALQEAHVKGWSMGAQICLPLDIGER